MNTSQRRASGTQASVSRWLVQTVTRAASSLAAALAECHRAQRELALLRLHPDTYTFNGDDAPDTYAEFLFRSPGTVWHEPSARERGSGPPRRAFGRSR